MTTNNHPAHGPVSLDRLRQIREILSQAAAQSDGGHLGYAMSDAVKVIDGAIASFGAESVAWMIIDIDTGEKIIRPDRSYFEGPCQPLYAAPQLPQPAVPECFQRLLHHAYGMAMGHDWNKGTMAGHHREKLCKAVEDCRAAMLGSNDPSETWGVKYIPLTGNSPVTPDTWIPVSERMPPNKPGSYEYIVFESLNNRAHHDYWNVPDGSCDDFSPFWNHYGKYVTHWMPLPAAPQQEVKSALEHGMQRYAGAMQKLSEGDK